MRITMLGGRETGKTSFFGALHAHFRHRQAASIIAKASDIELLRAEGVSEQAGFWISGYQHDSDRKALDGIAEGLSERPITWPPPTRVSDFFPMNIAFERWVLGSGQRSERRKVIELVDVPGGHFASYTDGDHDAERSRARASGSKALLVFIDAGDHSNITQRHGEVSRNIRSIIRDSAEVISDTGKILPVTVVFTKFDRHDPSRRQELHSLLFEEIADDIAGLQGKIFLMSCPTSVTSRRPDVLAPMNIQYPFLFSAMGIILSDHVDASAEAAVAYQRAQAARAVRRDSWLSRFVQFINERQTIGSMERTSAAFGMEAQKDLQLAKAIISSLKADLVLQRADLRFAQSGVEVDIRQLEAVL